LEQAGAAVVLAAGNGEGLLMDYFIFWTLSVLNFIFWLFATRASIDMVLVLKSPRPNARRAIKYSGVAVVAYSLHWCLTLGWENGLIGG
jgi:hypothetical protein